MLDTTQELNAHIMEKLSYHKKLWNAALAEEDYLTCAYHRDEVSRLDKMLKK